MPRNQVSAEPFVYDAVSYLNFVAGGTNRNDRKRMKGILTKAITSELTEHQRYCLVEYYLHGRKMKDIAVSLSVHPSTVTRHIRRATEKLRRIASYY